MKLFAGLAPELKLAMPIWISSIGVWIADMWFKFESVIPSLAGFVALIGGIIVAVGHYCRIVRENRESRENSKLKELEIDLRRLEKEGELLQNEGERLDNIQKDLTIQEQRLRIHHLEKTLGFDHGHKHQD